MPIEAIVLIGGLAGDPHADERDDVGGGVGERVEAVGEDRHRAGAPAEDDLGDGDGEVEEEDADQDRVDLAVPVGACLVF
jgi:hypothetical protein